MFVFSQFSKAGCHNSRHLLGIHVFHSCGFSLTSLVWLVNNTLTMGRKSKSGNIPLDKDQISFLKSLTTEALDVRAALEDDNSIFTTLQEWVTAIAIPRFNAASTVQATPHQEVVGLVHSLNCILYFLPFLISKYITGIKTTANGRSPNIRRIKRLN
jgi:hypothetical protein